MSQISPVDQALALLRERLRRLGSERTGNSRRSSETTATARTSSSALERLAAQPGLQDQPEEAQQRALVGALLADSFGSAVANDTAFQRIADQVTDMLRGSDEGRDLLARVLASQRRG